MSTGNPSGELIRSPEDDMSRTKTATAPTSLRMRTAGRLIRYLGSTRRSCLFLRSPCDIRCQCNVNCPDEARTIGVRFHFHVGPYSCTRVDVGIGGVFSVCASRKASPVVTELEDGIVAVEWLTEPDTIRWGEHQCANAVAFLQAVNRGDVRMV